MDERKIDFLGPAFIMAMIAASVSDFAFLFLFALIIPVIGFAIALMVVMLHYFTGLLLLFLIFPQLKHLIPKLTLILLIILPLPLLAIGMILAIIMQNRIIETIVTQAALTAITVLTEGTAAPLQVGVTAARAATTAAKVSTAITAARVGGAAVKGTEAATAARAGTLGAKAITAEKEAALGAKAASLETAEAEKVGVSAAEREGAPKQQGDTFEDKMRARKEKLNKILEKIHEKEDRDEIRKAEEAEKKKEEKNQV